MKTELGRYVTVKQPPDLSLDKIEQIRGACATLFYRLQIRDVGRIDLRVTPDGVPYFIEANALPALGVGGEFQEGARRRAGLDFDGLIRSVVESALQRYNLR